MIYKFVHLFLLAGTVISVMFILNDSPLLGFGLGMYMLAYLTRQDR